MNGSQMVEGHTGPHKQFYCGLTFSQFVILFMFYAHLRPISPPIAERIFTKEKTAL